MTHAYITGATGAIGMALVGELLKNKIKTTVFLREGSPKNSRMKDCFGDEIRSGLLRLEYVNLEQLAIYMCCGNADIQQDKKAVDATNNINGESHSECSTHKKNAYEKCAADTKKAVFYHLGWGGTFGAERNDEALQQKNVKYTLDAARLAKRLGCGHFVGVGSQAEYGRVEGKLTPDMLAAPENEYGKAKLSAGIKSRQLCRQLGIRHSWVRVLSVYGPFDGKNTMIMSVIRGLLSGHRVPLTKGEQVWNYLYSEDAARALFLLGKTALGSTMSAVYCLAGNSECKLREYILKLCSTMGADEKLLGFGDIPYSDKQVMYLTADIGSLTQDTGFVPETAFEDGIKRTVDWVKTFGIPFYGY